MLPIDLCAIPERDIRGTSRNRLNDTFKDRPDVAVAHVFLRYADRDTYAPKDIYPSLLGQIIQTNDRAFAALRPSFHGCKGNDGKFLDKLTQKEILKSLATATQQLTKVFIVIDGLDEASDAVQNSLLSELPRLGVNMLIMSRPLGELFKSHTPNALHVPIQARSHDINLLVRDRVRESGKLQSILKNDPELVTQLCARVNQRSQGM